MPIIPNREIEENKWSAQRYGLEGIFIDHETHEAVDTRAAIEMLVTRLSEATYRDLSGLERALGGPTESVRQLEVWRETGSTLEVAKDLARRTSAL
jgi:carboxylate-amine ligase